MVPGLRIHEICKDQVEQQNGDIHGVTSQSKLPLSSPNYR
jgi:hypothetical protein